MCPDLYALLVGVDPLSLVSSVKGPFGLAAFTIGAIGFYVANRLKPTNRISKLLLFGLAGLMVILAVFAIWSGRQDQPYRVSVLAVDAKGQPLTGVRMRFTTNVPGIAAEVNGSGTEFTINPAQLPKDGGLTIYADAPASFLTGRHAMTLGPDHNPTATIAMGRDVSGTVSGMVEAHGRPLAGATVWIEGSEAEAVHTGPLGEFRLAAHAANGQVVTLRAESGALTSLRSMRWFQMSRSWWSSPIPEAQAPLDGRCGTIRFW